MAETVLSESIFPKTSDSYFRHQNTSGQSVVTITGDYSYSYTCLNEGDYAYVSIRSGLSAGKYILHFDDFSSSDGEAWLQVRMYEGDSYTEIISLDGVSGAQEYEIELPTSCTRLDIRTRHAYASQGCDAVITVEGASLCKIETVASPTTLNFHKLQADNLPTSVTAGEEHIFFTTDGTRVRMYITNREGQLIEVTGLSAAPDVAETAKYSNPYTQAHIDARKQEIIDLTRQGHCITFAVATDIHLRIEDGDEGRVNQVRDFILLADQLPIDYIICEGDIMSYCLAWDGVFEPRADKVRKILDQCRCPWYVTRGNHDYNDDDYGADSNPNIQEYDATNADQFFISDRDWTRTIASKMPNVIQHEIHFDEAHPENGYFYVDDKIHKHRIIMCNSEETMETDSGKPYINDGQVVDAYISGVETKQQIDWLIDHAMNFSQYGADAQNWVVSFHSHTLPYSDRWIGYEGEDGELGGYKVYDAEKGNAADTSEFHGYGWDNHELRKLVHAFQFGQQLDFKKTVIDVDDVNDGVTDHRWISYERSVDFTQQGAMKVLGWFAGHCHADCHATVYGLNLSISTCTCASQRKDWSLDPTPSKPAPERNSTDLAMSVNVFVVNLDERKINVVKVGSKADNSVSTSSDYEMVY